MTTGDARGFAILPTMPLVLTFYQTRHELQESCKALRMEHRTEGNKEKTGPALIHATLAQIKALRVPT